MNDAPNPLMSCAEVAAYLHVSTETIRTWVLAKRFVEPVRVTPKGRTLKFRRSDVAAFVRSNPDVAVAAKAVHLIEQNVIAQLAEAGYNEDQARRIIAAHRESDNTGAETVSALTETRNN